MEPGDRLKLLIRASGKTQRDIARHMGVNPMWIANRVTGHSQINVQDVPKLAGAVGWDECEMFRALIGSREPYPDHTPEHDAFADFEAERLARRYIATDEAYEREKAGKLAEYAAFLDWQEQRQAGE